LANDQNVWKKSQGDYFELKKFFFLFKDLVDIGMD